MTERFNQIVNEMQSQIDLVTPSDLYEDSLRKGVSSYLDVVRERVGSGKFREARAYLESAAKFLFILQTCRPRSVEDHDVVKDAQDFVKQCRDEEYKRVLESIESTDPSQFTSSYSGSHGCCCGCRGNHTKEVRTIKATRTKMMNAIRENKATEVYMLDNGFAVDTITRTYIIRTK